MFNRNYIIAYPGGVHMKTNNRKIEKIDVSVNRIYVVKDGRAVPIDPPSSGYGEQTAVWKDGKVIDVIDTKRIRI